MKTWHGYPIPDDAHSTRPWWRKGGWCEMRYNDTFSGLVEVTGWRRTDDATATEPAAYDHEHPLPAPPLLCGQVWHLSNGWIVQAEPIGGGVAIVLWNLSGDLVRTWDAPPPGAVLVAGPGSPWAPPEYEPEEVKS